jgi:hypothetical protein
MNGKKGRGKDAGPGAEPIRREEGFGGEIKREEDMDTPKNNAEDQTE